MTDTTEQTETTKEAGSDVAEVAEEVQTEMTEQSEPEGTEEQDSGRDWSEFIPDVDLPSGSLQGGTDILREYGILAAYKRWCGKSEPNPGHRTESIKISCPNLDHPDKNPSAWLNSIKNLWNCGVCDEGGDIIDLGAIHYGIDYRHGGPGEFTRLLELMLNDIGFDVEALRARNAEAAAKGTATWAAPDEDPGAETATATETATEATAPGGATIAAPHEPDDDDDDDGSLGDLDAVPLRWEEIVDSAPDSFLAKWMARMSPSVLPNEYLFWLGLQMIGLAMGRQAYLEDESPIYSNLMIAFIGPSGNGKSRSASYAADVLREGLPFEANEPTSKGVQLLPRPGSGEALYDMFSWKPDDKYRGTSGLVIVNELSELMTAAKRKGSTLKEAIIGLFDNQKELGYRTKGDGTVTVVEPFMTLITGGQPGVMEDILSASDTVSGFANRFLFVSGEEAEWRSHGDREKIDLTGLSTELAIVHKRPHGRIDIEPTAIPRFDETLKWLNEVRKRPNGDIYARLDLHAKKLVAILCVNYEIELATVEVIEQVHHLIETVIPTTGEVARQITESQADYYRRRVLQEIDNRKGAGRKPPTRRELVKAVTRAKRNSIRTGEAITYLERNGIIVKCYVKAKSGEATKTERWKRA